MNLVPSFDTCKQLKEVGWDSPVYYEYAIFIDDDDKEPHLRVGFVPGITDDENYYPAPTAQELKDYIQSSLKSKRSTHTVTLITVIDDNYIDAAVEFLDFGYEDRRFSEWLETDNEAESLAQLYIKLKKEGMV